MPGHLFACAFAAPTVHCINPCAMHSAPWYSLHRSTPLDLDNCTATFVTRAECRRLTGNYRFDSCRHPLAGVPISGGPHPCSRRSDVRVRAERMIGYLSQRRGRGFKSRRHSTGCVVDERPKSLKRRLAPTLLVPLLTPRRAAQAWAHAARRGFHVKRRAESQSVTCRASRLVVQDRTPGEGLASCRHRSTGRCLRRS